MIASRFFSGLIYSGLALFGGLWIGYAMVQTAWSLGQDPKCEELPAAVVQAQTSLVWAQGCEEP